LSGFVYRQFFPGFQVDDFNFRFRYRQPAANEGLMGIPMQVVGGILIGFLLFAGILIKTGAGDFFLRLAMVVGGATRGGMAKVAVIGSALFGSLSGSVFSNIVGTGSITIPGMKKGGYPPHYAGAIEAVASTGGVLMPPVMGAVAFIMASLTGIPYAKIMVAAAIPSFLFYLGLFVQVDGYAAKTGMKGLPPEERPQFWQVMKEGWHFIFVLVFLIWGLLYMRWEALAPFYASALLLILAMLRKSTRLNAQKALETLDGVGKLLAETLGIILPLGLVVAGLVITGIAPAFTTAIIKLSGGIPLVALLFGAAACYVLGMAGMLTAAYIFLAMSLAPILVNAGFNVLGVHLFIIYYAMLSSITPPVAVGAFLAASIAKAEPMKTAVNAMKLGVAIYIIPLFFVYEPALVLQGPWQNVLLHISTAIVGVALLASSLEGYLVGAGSLSLFLRVGFFISGLALAVPDWKFAIGGILLAALLYVVAIIRNRGEQAIITG
jgi:TRAP transporter 4TM/12TM fusion protein